MISSNDFRTGMTIEVDGEVLSVVEFQHVKPGKGAAFVRTKLKNVRTGAVLERTFAAGEKVPRAHLERREMQYLYADGDQYYFMDMQTYDQIVLSSEQLSNALNYLIDNMTIWVLMSIDSNSAVPFPDEWYRTSPGPKAIVSPSAPFPRAKSSVSDASDVFTL